MPLTPKVFDVLRVLVEHSGHLVEKDVLLKEVWPDSFVEEGALSRSVSILRKVFDDSPAGQEYIETVPKRGYRFVAPVTVCHRGEAVIADRGDRIAAVPSEPAAAASASSDASRGGRLWLRSGRRRPGERCSSGVLTYGPAERDAPDTTADTCPCCRRTDR